MGSFLQFNFRTLLLLSIFSFFLVSRGVNQLFDDSSRCRVRHPKERWVAPLSHQCVNIDLWVPAHHLIDQLILYVQALPDLSLLIFEFLDIPLNQCQCLPALLLSALQDLIFPVDVPHLPGDFQAVGLIGLGALDFEVLGVINEESLLKVARMHVR